MTMTANADETTMHQGLLPGAQLASLREARGMSTEYVASKLNLRSHLIELLEADAYDKMPEIVFIKGYIRGYAKLLDVAYEPLLEAFNQLNHLEKKVERALWQQSKKERHIGESIIRGVTFLFAVGVLTAVGLWWYNNRENFQEARVEQSHLESVPVLAQNTDIRLTDLSKMREVLVSSLPFTPTEQVSE